MHSQWGSIQALQWDVCPKQLSIAYWASHACHSKNEYSQNVKGLAEHAASGERAKMAKGGGGGGSQLLSPSLPYRDQQHEMETEHAFSCLVWCAAKFWHRRCVGSCYLRWRCWRRADISGCAEKRQKGHLWSPNRRHEHFFLGEVWELQW